MWRESGKRGAEAGLTVHTPLLSRTWYGEGAPGARGEGEGRVARRKENKLEESKKIVLQGYPALPGVVKVCSGRFCHFVHDKFMPFS